MIVLTTLALSAGSTAVAYWTTTGGGGGSGASGSAQAVTLSPGTPTTQLYPGGKADVAVTIDNPNPFRVHVGSLSLSTGLGVGGYNVDGGHAGCATTVLSFTTQTNEGAGWAVPPKVGTTDGSLSLDLTGALAMSAGAASACQGASFDVYLAAGP